MTGTDHANPADAYRRHTSGTWLTQAIAEERNHRTLDDTWRLTALDGCEAEIEHLARLARETETHGPLQAARNALSPEERE